MSAHIDILDEQERLAKPFWSSLFLHAGLAAVVLSYGKLGLGSHSILMGDPHGGGFGSVAVSAVSSIPLPPKSGPVNPVANDTESHVPAPPPKAKPQTKVKTPPPDAVPLPTRNAKLKAAERVASERNFYREQQKDLRNQLYTSGGQALSSPMYNISGGGGVGVGNNNPFGTQFGGYAAAVRDKVARMWNTADLSARAPAVVTFTILKDGSVPPQSIRIGQSSGNRELDLSARRAVEDASPFPPLPPGFPRSDATVELHFELRH